MAESNQWVSTSGDVSGKIIRCRPTNFRSGRIDSQLGLLPQAGVARQPLLNNAIGAGSD